MAQNFDLSTDYSNNYMNRIYEGKVNPGKIGGPGSLGVPSQNNRPKKIIISADDDKAEGIRVKGSGNNAISKTYKSVQSAATSLKNAAKELTKEDPVDPRSVASFVDNYNKTLDSFKNTSNLSLQKKGEQMMRFTSANAGQLSKVGITIDENNNLKVDNDKLSSSKPEDMKNLFNESNSFGQQIYEKAGQIEGMSKNTVNKISKMYDGAGAYRPTFNPDSIINNYF